MLTSRADRTVWTWLALAVACGDAGPARPLDAAVAVAAAADAAAGVVDTTVFMPSCVAHNHACTASSGAHCGECQYRIRFDGARCSPAQPCDDLFLWWAFMGCDGAPVAGLLDGIRATHPTYVTACVQPMYPGEMLPTSLGAPERDDAVMTALLTALRSGADTGAWSGKNLLMGGCSAGASRYPVVAARYPDDAQWLGTGKTAACFSDGVVSIDTQDDFIGAVLATGGTSCGARHARIASAYTVASPTASHACTASPQGQCACDPGHAARLYPGDCADGDCVPFDSIVRASPAGPTLAADVSAAAFAVRDWRLVAEGEDFRTTASRCDRDIVPEAPFRALCDAVDADPARTCSFVSRPAAGHCTDYLRDIGPLCVDWFDAL
jgi:hypothetical protein